MKASCLLLSMALASWACFWWSLAWAWLGVGGRAYLLGDVIDEPFPVHGWQWAIVLAPLLAGISLYVLSGLFKGLAEE